MQKRIAIYFVISLLMLFAPSFGLAQSPNNGAQNGDSIKRITGLNPTTAGQAKGAAKVYLNKQTGQEQFQVLATGLRPESEFHILINGTEVAVRQSNRAGALEFIHNYDPKNGNSSEDALSQAPQAPQAMPSVTNINEIVVRDSKGENILTGQYLAVSIVDDGISPKLSVPDITVEAGKSVTVPITVNDPDGDPVTLSVTCSKGNFITVNGLTLVVSPTVNDAGVSSCVLTAVDQFNLTTTTAFTVTVTPANRAPVLSPVADVVVKAGQNMIVTICATDPDNDFLRFSVNSTLPYISFGDGTFNCINLRLNPGTAESQGGQITVTATDPGGLSSQVSFKVTVQATVQITSVVFASSSKNLFISGFGFGSTTPTVNINGQDVTARVIGSSANSITLRGNKRKLNLKATGSNSVTVTVGGVSSPAYVFSL